VLGIGYAATRDLNSFLRYETQDNPSRAESNGDWHAAILSRETFCAA